MTIPREVYENLEDLFGNCLQEMGIATDRIKKSSDHPEVQRMVLYLEDAIERMGGWRNFVRPGGGRA